MKTVISSQGNSIEAKFDLRFGRAAWFCIFDESKQTFEFIKNEDREANNGAGVKVVEKMAEWSVNKIISGDFGSKARDVLEKLDIQMVIINEEKYSIEDIVNKLIKKERS